MPRIVKGKVGVTSIDSAVIITGKAGEGELASSTNPILVAGEDDSGNVKNIHVDTATGDQYVIVSSGSLNVASLIPGTGASNLGKPEDGAHTSGDVGVMSLAVRNDSNTARTGTDGDYCPINVDANGNTMGVGNVAHDAVDAGSPLKTGGKAVDYTPDSEGEQGATAVAAADRANAAFNLRGEFIGGVKPEYNLMTAIDNVFDSAAETVTSSNYVCWQYRVASLSMDLTKSGTPTDILVTVECSIDGTNYEPYVNNGMADIRESNASIGSGKKFHLVFPIACQKIRVKLTSSGTDGSNTITSDNSAIYFRT